MAKILLDYVFPITQILPTPAASTAMLKQVCVVAKPKAGQEGNVGSIYECSSMTAVAARTDNTNAQQLFNAGMNKVFVLLSDDLDLEAALDANPGNFYTLLISDDFDDDDLESATGVAAVRAAIVKDDLTFIARTAGAAGNSTTIALVDAVDAGEEVAHAIGTAVTVKIKTGVSTAQQIKDAIDDSVSASALMTVAIAAGHESDAQAAAALDNLEGGSDATESGLSVGTFDGVVGFSSQDDEVAADFAAIEKRSGWFTGVTNKAKNMFYAFGKLLSNDSDWLNQQYISMPLSDSIVALGDAESLFEDKVSFVLEDDEFSHRLGLFAAGGRAIVAPYIIKNFMIDLQSAALTWISGNQPQYNLKNAALLETRLQEDVINADYIQENLIDRGVVEISLVEDNFVANGDINIAEPKALWRVSSLLKQTL